jgi:ElaB/YqjD/DUF883 family membrane-anchored ribosome-binding protein
MKQNLFKSLLFSLLSIFFFLHPFNISAATHQKQAAENTKPVFEKKVKVKQSFFQKIAQKFIQKRIEKVLKKQSKRNFEQEQPNQTVGIIALLSLFIGFVLLLASVGIGALLVFIALLLSIIGLITEETPIYARRTFWISLVLTIYILARIRNVI